MNDPLHNLVVKGKTASRTLQKSQKVDLCKKREGKEAGVLPTGTLVPHELFTEVRGRERIVSVWINERRKLAHKGGISLWFTNVVVGTWWLARIRIGIKCGGFVWLDDFFG